MKHFTKFRAFVLSISAVLLSATTFPSFAETAALSEQEFAHVCEENNAGQSRSIYPPRKEADPDFFNYEFHYKEVLFSSDGKSVTDQAKDMKYYRNLLAGQVIMDMEDGYEMSYEYHIQEVFGENADEIVIKGGKITPYYRAVPSSETADSEKRYTYISNKTEEIPVIPDFPLDYDWQKHEEKTLLVHPQVTVHSLKDGSTYSYTSRVSYVTNLDKNKPDCYTLTPTDLEAYTVKKGDSLQKIAGQYYGNSADWIYILERNRDSIKNADLISPGTLIVIPNAEAVRR